MAKPRTPPTNPVETLGLGSSLEVVIVSDNRETLDGLLSYMKASGVNARGTRDIACLHDMLTPTSVAVVIFPDDFHWETVVSAIADFDHKKHSASRRRILSVLVTSHPSRFESLTAGTGVLVFPRPAWGWTIVDAIRDGIVRSAARSSGSSDSSDRPTRQKQ